MENLTLIIAFAISESLPGLCGGAGVGLKLMTSFADRISANILSTTRVQTLWLLWAVKVFSWPLACYAKFWEKMHKYQN